MEGRDLGRGGRGCGRDVIYERRIKIKKSG